MEFGFDRMTRIMNGIALIGQLGLSLVMPLLICIAVCYLIIDRTGAGSWVYIPGFILGLGGSFSTALGVYRSVLKRSERGGAGKKRSSKEVSVSRHL